MRKLSILFILLVIPSIIYAEDTFEGFGARVESWAEGLNGYVVTSNGSTIDLGKNANVVKGMEFITSRDGEKLIHPITNESLGVKKVVTGKISILTSEEKYSTTKIITNNGIKKGDRVEHIFPVPVSFKTQYLQDNEIAQIKYAVFKSSALKEDNSSKYSIFCGRENSGSNTAKCSLMFNGVTIFSDDIAVKGMKIISTKKASANKVYKIEHQVYSMAVGFFLGKKKEYLIATSDRKSIIFYNISQNQLVDKYSISPRGRIINIESYDINGNGIDELIVSMLDRKNNTISKIYEYDGKTFKLIEEKIPYLFRTYFADGKKHLICQAYSEGSMVGHIYNVSYKKDSGYIYESNEGLEVGTSIYGYGATENYNIYFDRHGLLNKKNETNNIVYKNLEFGNTINYIMFIEKLNTGMTVGETGESAGFFVYDEKDVVKSVYQRIIQLKNGLFLLSSNKLTENNIMGSFKNAMLGAYFLTDNIETAWQTQINGNAITDIDILSDGSEIIYIYSKNKNGIDDIYMDIIENDAF